MISKTWGSFPEKNFGFEVKLQIWSHFGSNFKHDAKYANHISKWSSWYQLFKLRQDIHLFRGNTQTRMYLEEWYIRFGSNHSYQVIRWKWIRWWHQILNPLTHFRFTGKVRFETFERHNINLFWPILA